MPVYTRWKDASSAVNMFTLGLDCSLIGNAFPRRIVLRKKSVVVVLSSIMWDQILCCQNVNIIIPVIDIHIIFPAIKLCPYIRLVCILVYREVHSTRQQGNLIGSILGVHYHESNFCFSMVVVFLANGFQPELIYSWDLWHLIFVYFQKLLYTGGTLTQVHNNEITHGLSLGNSFL